MAIVALMTPLFLAGCGGDPGGHNPSDGIWTISYNTGQANTPNTTCSIPDSSVTLVNGAGSTTLTETCLVSVIDVNGIVTSTTTVTTALLTSVNITSGIKAIVNGNTYSGQCVSQNGCSAQATSGTGSITMIR